MSAPAARDASPKGWRSVASAWLPGVGATLGAALVAEVLAHGPAPAPPPYPSAALLGGLVAVAFSAFRGGARVGLLGALLLTAYALHFFSPHGVLVDRAPEALRNAALVGALGVLMALVVGAAKRREDRLQAALLAREREHAEALARVNRGLREANEALEAFTYVVSHDLKEPVRAVATYLEAAREELGTPEAEEMISRAERANQRMAAMLRGLLEWSRASTGSLDLEPVRVQDVLHDEDARPQFQHLLDERRGTLVVDDDLPPVLATRSLVAQAFGNLVANALKHNDKPRPFVRVRLRAMDDEAVELAVEDDGPGFPPRVLAGFGRIGADAGARGGFGLAIAKRAVERAGGSLRLARRPEGGSEAIVRLRRAPEPRAEAVARRVAELV